jgi:hypothetical protein
MALAGEAWYGLSFLAARIAINSIDACARPAWATGLFDSEKLKNGTRRCRFFQLSWQRGA